MRYQIFQYLPWFWRRYLRGKKEKKPSLYVDMIWGSTSGPTGIEESPSTPRPPRGDETVVRYVNESRRDADVDSLEGSDKLHA